MTLNLIQSTDEQREAEILRLCAKYGQTKDRVQRFAIKSRLMGLRALRGEKFLRGLRRHG